MYPKFVVKNVRTGSKPEVLTSQQLKQRILHITRAKYEVGNVLQERTGERPKVISNYLKNSDSLIVHDNVFLVSAVARLNNDKKTRYLILIDGEKYSQRITEIVHDYIPIYSIKIEGAKREPGKASLLSKWFRKTMGKGFSFIDIDYLITNQKSNKVVIVEEKIGKEKLEEKYNYGQLRSYQELLNDVINKDAKLYFAFVLGRFIKYKECYQNTHIRADEINNSRFKQVDLSGFVNIIKQDI